MEASYIFSNNIKSLENQLEEYRVENKIKSALFVMAEDEHYSNDLIKPLVKKFRKPIIGGIFPELIYQGERKKQGVLLLPLPFELKTQLFDLSETSEDFLKQLELEQKDSLDPSSTLFVFTDALSNNKESFIEALFNFFGINPTYIGGGAGSLKFKSFPCIITNSGLHTNSVVIGWTNKKSALGVAHGWRAVSDPLKVTKAMGNQLISLNWKPAFEVYKDIVESHSGMKFTSDNFFDIAKSYPLGIAKIDAEMVVRDPFMATDEVIHLVDKINEGEYVNILNGDMDSLLAGATKAKGIAMSKTDESMDKESIFCIDCISRVLYMQNNFIKELEVIGYNVNVNGILTIGEIANSEESFLEIYNKTIVIGVW